MATHNIQGNLLYVTVNSCNKLKDTEWISRQDPYVCVEYGGNKFQTRTCTDGGKNPTFQEKFVYTLIEGLRELNVTVLNSNIVIHDDFIGSGKVPLSKVLSKGFDDSFWPLQTRNGRHAGEVRLIMEVDKTTNNIHAPVAQLQSQPLRYAAPPPYAPSPPCVYAAPPPGVWYTPPAAGFPYQPAGGGFPAPSSCQEYPPNYGGYLYQPQPAPYVAQPYPPTPAYPQPYESSHPHCSCYPSAQPPPHRPRKL